MEFTGAGRLRALVGGSLFFQGKACVLPVVAYGGGAFVRRRLTGPGR